MQGPNQGLPSDTSKRIVNGKIYTFGKQYSQSLNLPNTVLQTTAKSRENHQSYQDLLKTPSNIKKWTVQPVNLKELVRLSSCLAQLQQSNQKYSDDWSLRTFVLIARIASIEPFPHKYVFHCRDDSIEKADIEVSMLKIAMGRITYYQNRGSVTTHSFNKHKTTLEELSCLQFETLPNVGVPYFKFYLKLSRLYNGHQEEAGRVRWHVESMERVTDYNELTYHFSKMMAYELLSLN